MRKPSLIFPGTYFPAHAQNRMASEGDITRSRSEFLSRKPANLENLLRHRYQWMNEFIHDSDIVLEIGAGAGLSKCFLNNKLVLLTDVTPHPWIDLCVDARHLPFADETIDVVIVVNVLHHLATPINFLEDAYRSLKVGGYILLIEPNPSLLLLAALRIMRHEGWSFQVDVFDRRAEVNDPFDPWSGNNAISFLLFEDKGAFQFNLPGFKVVRDWFSECVMFPLSGGVTAKIKTIELPIPILNIINWLDRRLCQIAPMLFAMARSVVLRKCRLVTA